MAATVDIRPTLSTPTVWQDTGKEFLMLSSTIDFTVSANQLAQNATMAIFDIPAGYVVSKPFILVATADTDVTDVDLGITTDGSTSAGLIDGATLATTGYKVGAGTYMVNVAATQLVLTNKDADTINGAKIQVGCYLTPATSKD